jgi:hexulose-6-phosphate isomerase
LEAHLEWLLTRCSLAGIERVVLPFVDASRMDTAARQARVTGMLRRVVARAKATGVEIHLETSLDPAAFAALLDEVPHSMLKANYDSGNSASLGYDVRQELAAYGNRIGSVHIKDRIRGGGTVPLGTGNADLPALFTELAATEYAGDFVLQVARELPGNEIAWARQNREWVMGQLEAAFPVAAGSWF